MELSAPRLISPSITGNMVVISAALRAKSTGRRCPSETGFPLHAFECTAGCGGRHSGHMPPLGGRLRIDSLPGLPHIYRNAVAPSYFGLVKLPSCAAGTFLLGEQNAVAVSESAARAIWPNQASLPDSYACISWGVGDSVAGHARVANRSFRDAARRIVQVRNSAESRKLQVCQLFAAAGGPGAVGCSAIHCSRAFKKV